MSGDELDAVVDVAARWDDLWERELRHTHAVNCCVLATRVAIIALGERGVTAWPIPTITTWVNAPARACIEAKVPKEQWPEFAWSIQAGPVRGAVGYPGHLWAGTSTWMVDLSARQFHRPGKIDSTRALVVPRGYGVLDLPGGGALVVVEHNDHTYRRANDWRVNARPVAARLNPQAPAKFQQ